ncbi:MAG: FAD-dependent oxidoreductase, partial [Rhodospirillales bacterium]|nr:FAD-dependent oxidoreductase [Rhodospirillales bacterium]
QASKITPPEPFAEGDFNSRVLVVGGGVAGMTAAWETARAGHEAILVEKSGSLGGWSSNWSKRMPHLPPYRGPMDNEIGTLVAEVEGDPQIIVLTGTKVTRTAGMPGRFEVTMQNGGGERTELIGAIVVATGWRPYDPNKLGHLGYGGSPDVVTNVELEEMLAGGPPARKSDGQAPKNVAFIQCAGSRDPDHLPYCSSVCCGVSIKQALQVAETDPQANIYVIYEELRMPGTAEEFYRQAQEAGIIFIKGKVKRVGADLSVVYDDELLGEEIPMAGLDLVVLATGMVPNSTDPDAPASEIGQELLLDDIDPLAPLARAGREMPEEETVAEKADETEDPVIDADAVPPGGSILNLQYRQGPHIPILADGFSDSHYICFPYETRRTGIYTCGPVRRPMDMAETQEDAAGAILKAIQSINNAKQGASVHPRTGDLSYPKIGLDTCTKCRRCTVECPFGA